MIVDASLFLLIKAIKAVSDTELEGFHLSGMSAAILEGSLFL